MGAIKEQITAILEMLEDTPHGCGLRRRVGSASRIARAARVDVLGARRDRRGSGAAACRGQIEVSAGAVESGNFERETCTGSDHFWQSLPARDEPHMLPNADDRVDDATSAAGPEHRRAAW